MKTFLKVVGGIVLVVLALVAGALTWLSLKRPAARPASAEKIELTPARMARGQYLVENVTNCIDCHSDHTARYGFPVKPGTEGRADTSSTSRSAFRASWPRRTSPPMRTR